MLMLMLMLMMMMTMMMVMMFCMQRIFRGITNGYVFLFDFCFQSAYARWKKKKIYAGACMCDQKTRKLRKLLMREKEKRNLGVCSSQWKHGCECVGEKQISFGIYQEIKTNE
jgi:hypothetical protein